MFYLIKFTPIALFSALSLVLGACGSDSGTTQAPISTNADLSDLTLSGGDITPSFQSDVFSYRLTVTNAVTSTTVTPATSDMNAEVTVNDVAVGSGTASTGIALTEGSNSITIEVTAEDGRTRRIYTVAVTRLPATPPPQLNNIARLSSLALSAGNITPTFQSDRFSYSLSVASNVASTTVTATSLDANASITVDGASVISGSTSATITIVEGDNSIIVEVTAEDGATRQIYTVNVNRPLPPITSFELIDPTPGIADNFGESVAILPNGNIVVTDPRDSSLASSNTNGAVHLFNSVTQAPVASIYGDNGGDRLGSGGVIALANGNFVIASPFDHVGGILQAGSVMLVNGETGQLIGSPVTGESSQDKLGSGGITVLANNNFVIVSPHDDHGSISDAGSVRLVNGETGALIGIPVFGDSTGDAPGWSSITQFVIPHFKNFKGITALVNGNYVIASPDDDVGVVVDAGTVRLMDGKTGNQVGNPVLGSSTEDRLGSGGITVLANSNLVIASPHDDVSGVVNAGSVRLVSGLTGLQIGNPDGTVGDVTNDQLGSGGVSALANGNYVIVSEFDDEGGIVDVGTARLVNGTTGNPVNVITGELPGDQIGFNGITTLPNNNFVIASQFDDEDGISLSGSVRLVNGITGDQINMMSGDTSGDLFGSGGTFALKNNNYVISSPGDDESGVTGAGSVRLVNGTSGVQIGSTISGDKNNDHLGQTGITVLGNDNFVIASQFDDEGVIVDAGSVRLVNGETGIQIGGTIAGNMAEDRLGSGSVTGLVGNNFVVISPHDDNGVLVDAGSVRKVDGVTGVQIGSAIAGTSAFDFVSGVATSSPGGEFYIFSSVSTDRNGLVDSGLVRLIAQ